MPQGAVPSKPTNDPFEAFEGEPLRCFPKIEGTYDTR